ncbi:MAG: ligase-associated DNA damage response exonuclease [Pseudomonadota bacterium]
MSDLVLSTDSGLYCPAGDFHIDPHLPVPRAVITHAHADHARPGMGHYWAAKAGQGLMRARVGRDSAMSLLDYGQRTDIGRATVSLHPAGHVLGSAQVRIEVDGEVWVVSGDYKRCPDPSCAPFEPVPCDTFVTEATFAQPHYCWDAPAAVAGEIFDWWQQCRVEGKAAVLFCYALGKAQRVLAELVRFFDADALARGEVQPVLLHGAMTPLVAIYRKAGIRMLPTEAVGTPPRGTDFSGRLVLAPPGAKGTPWMRQFQPYSTGFASGWMRLDDSQRRQSYDRGFTLSDHSDWPGLIRSIEECGARRVLTMHGDAAALIAHLRARGINAADLSAQAPTP